MINGYKDAQNYLKTHWLAILIGAIPTIAVAIVSIINFITFIDVNYQELKTSVDADNQQVQVVLQSNQKLLQNDAQIRQEQMDQGKQLDTIQNNTDAIYRYFFDKK